MMLLFNAQAVRKALTISLLMLLSACATQSGLDKPASQKDDIPVQPTQQQTESAAGELSKPIRQSRFNPSLKDPMANGVLTEKAKAVFSQVKSLIKQKQYRQAESQLINLIASSASTDDVKKSQSSSSQTESSHSVSSSYYYLARVYLLEEQLTKALDAIERALKLNPTNYYALNLKGIILREQGAFSQAKQAYLLAIKQYANFAHSHLNLAILADIYLYDYQLALNHYDYYLGLVNTDDKKVEGWVLDLKRRMPQTQGAK